MKARISMKNFTFCSPTKVVFGRNTQEQVGELTHEFGGRRVLLHYGSGSVVRSGLLAQTTKSLEEHGISYVELDGAVPNPRLSKVYEGIELCRKEKIDFILAVGGGSAIDSAKAIAMGVPYTGDVWDFFTKGQKVEKALPIGTILTLAATGSELSSSTVITNEEGWLKRGRTEQKIRPAFSILNPELTMTLPAYQTASGTTDIMMHTMERYFTRTTHRELTDRMSEGLIRTVMFNAKQALLDPDNYDARAELMWAGSLSHNDLMHCGSSRGDWACHQLEHELGGMFDVAHGAGLAAVWGSWARMVMPTGPSRFYQFAVNVMGCPPNTDVMEETAMRGIEETENFFRSLGMPTNLSELGITPTDAQLDELAYKCSYGRTRTIGNYTPLDEKAIREIYVNALS